MSGPQGIFDTALLTQRKDRYAQCESPPDFLLNRVADELAERLQIVKRTFVVAACLGALNGVLGRRLRGLAQVATVIDVESSRELLKLCDGLAVQADIEALPFGEATLDLAVSALTLQLVNDLPGTLLQIRRTLKPDGLFLAALLGARR
jgi:Methylase involved in ubiquinone/menaquinone biosynthesis